MSKEALKQGADILCIQETPFQTQKAPKCMHREYPHVFLACTSDSKKGGLMLALRSSLSFQLKESYIDEGGRYIIITMDINSKPYTLVTVYSPNNHQICFLKKVLKKTKSMQYGSLIIGGDFNIADPALDTTTVKPNRSTHLHHLLHTQELFDAWRRLHANERNYTFFSTRHCSYSHIDIFLTDQWLLQRIRYIISHGLTMPQYRCPLLNRVSLPHLPSGAAMLSYYKNLQ